MVTRIVFVVGVGAFFAINLWLWSLRISQQALFLLTVPLGILYFVAFIWYVMRSTENHDSIDDS